MFLFQKQHNGDIVLKTFKILKELRLEHFASVDILSKKG
jgi:hypothetical protein